MGSPLLMYDVSQPDHHSFSRYTHRRAGPKHGVPAGQPNAAEGAAGNSPVQLDIQEKYVVINNGTLELTLTNPGGVITCINYNGIDNLLESRNEEIDRGYWNMVWSDDNTTRKKGNFDRLFATKLNVVEQNEEKVEVSFVKTWDPSLEGKEVSLNIDKRFVVLRGSSGFYSYAIYGRPSGWPSFDLDNTRIAFKLRKRQASVETKKWPYDFLAALEFSPSAHRGSVSGTLFVSNRTFNEKNQSASGAYIILAILGLVGSWRLQTKGYQFWTEADESGSFKIENIRPGEYNLYASVPGFIGDYMYNTVIKIRPALQGSWSSSALSAQSSALSVHSLLQIRAPKVKHL